MPPANRMLDNTNPTPNSFIGTSRKPVPYNGPIYCEGQSRLGSRGMLLGLLLVALDQVLHQRGTLLGIEFSVVIPIECVQQHR